MLDLTFTDRTRYTAPLAPEPSAPRTLPAEYTFIRVLHELELAPDLPHTTPPDRPEVRQLYPENTFVEFGKAWQFLAWDMNPLCNSGNMTAVYDYRLWIANNNGFRDESDPRANYFTNNSLTKPPPKVEALTCGGNVHRVIGETIIMRGGQAIPSYILEVLDYRNAPPSLEWINARPWLWVWAVNMGTNGMPRRFEQGSQPNGFIPGVRHPFVSDPSKIITIPKWRCVRWTEPNPPDPYRIYING